MFTGSLLRSPTEPNHKKMASCNKRLKLFFSSLNRIEVFFTISPKCNSQLKKFYSAQIPRVCETRWNYISRIISAVRSNREQILERFTSIQNGEGWDQKSFCVSIGFTKIWEYKEFIFFVEFFDGLFKHVSVLLEILQSKKSNSITSEETLKPFVTAVNHLRGNVVKYWNNSEQSEAITEYITSQQAKRPKRAATHASVSPLQLQSCATEACDTITEEVEENVGSWDIFCSFSIVNPAEFELYKNSFPDNCVKEITLNYTSLIKIN